MQTIENIEKTLKSKKLNEALPAHIAKNFNGVGKIYHVSSAAIADIDRIINKTKLSWSYLSDVINKNITIIINKDYHYRLHREGDALEVITVLENEVLYDMFSFVPVFANVAANKDNIDHIILLYKVLCYIFLATPEKIEIKPSQKKYTQDGKELVRNHTQYDVIMVNSRWNTTTIRTEGFSVSSHFAFRRCGVGRNDMRLVYIEEYKKHGYTRLAGKLKNEENP